jgi:hypothetical protein
VSSLSDIAAGRTKRQLGTSGGGGDEYPVRMLNVGDEVAGKFVGVSAFDSKFNPDKQVSYYRFETEDGEKFSLRSKGDLDDGMSEAEEGMLLSVERLPDKKTKSGYPFAQFVVCELV